MSVVAPDATAQNPSTFDVGHASTSTHKHGLWHALFRRNMFWLRFALWSGLVLLATGWQAACAFSDVDLKNSSAHCLVKKSAPGKCDTSVGDSFTQRFCIGPGHINSLAPRWLGVLVVYVGPIWTWLPLAIWLLLRLRQTSPAHRRHLAVAFAPAFFAAVGAFLAFINLMRYLSRLPVAMNPTGFDPSGHTFVFGLQLVPLWCLTEVLNAAARPPSLQSSAGGSPVADSRDALSPAAILPAHRPHGRADRYLLAIFLLVEVGLWALTATTASFFHSTSEIFASWAVIAGLAFITLRLVMTKEFGAHGAEALSPGDAAARAETKARDLSRRILIGSAVVWALTTAIAFYLASMVPGSRLRVPALVQHAAFDLALIGVAGLVYSCLQPPHARGAGPSLSSTRPLDVEPNSIWPSPASPP